MGFRSMTHEHLLFPNVSEVTAPLKLRWFRTQPSSVWNQKITSFSPNFTFFEIRVLTWVFVIWVNLCFILSVPCKKILSIAHRNLVYLVSCSAQVSSFCRGIAAMAAVGVNYEMHLKACTGLSHASNNPFPKLRIIPSNYGVRGRISSVSLTCKSHSPGANLVFPPSLPSHYHLLSG